MSSCLLRPQTSALVCPHAAVSSGSGLRSLHPVPRRDRLIDWLALKRADAEQRTDASSLRAAQRDGRGWSEDSGEERDWEGAPGRRSWGDSFTGTKGQTLWKQAWCCSWLLCIFFFVLFPIYFYLFSKPYLGAKSQSLYKCWQVILYELFLLFELSSKYL